MKQRKNWSNEEDQALKYIIQVKGITKWSLISQTMEKQFALTGRNGKQCRERYHNHLDKNISNKDWSLEEEDRLFQMQDQLGNKWALISSKLPGRTDNCVKNHFYSKLRKAVRKINKKINKHLKRQFKEIKTAILYKIIEIMENSNKLGFNIPTQTVQLCKKIKNLLRRYEDDSDGFDNQQEELTFIRDILEDISFFDKDIKKPIKKGNLKNSAKFSGDEEYTPSTKSCKNVVSTKSINDDQSQNSNSDLFSSSSFDRRQFCNNRSQRLLRADIIHCKSMSIASESEEQSEVEVSKEEKEHLYNSARLKGQTKNQLAKEGGNLLSVSLTLPVVNHKPLLLPKKEEILEQKKSSSSKSGSEKDKEESGENLMTYKYMMEGQEPFAMRLLSPKKPTVEEMMEMNGEHDDLFYGQSMQIEDSSLIMKIEGMNINGIPKLGHSLDL